MFEIRSKREGFRRCGVAHTVEATEYKDNFFTQEELEQISDEPMLILRRDVKPGAVATMESCEAMDRALSLAIAQLDPDKENREDWTAGGVPQLRALTKITGGVVIADMRDLAYEKFEASQVSE